MKKDRLLNPDIARAVAALGHTETLCIADCGLPIPGDVQVIDVSVTAGVPSFGQLLRAVAEELVIEGYILAGEIADKNPVALADIEATLPGIPRREVPHEEFKALCKNARCVIRTGETSPYANVLLIGGVNF